MYTGFNTFSCGFMPRVFFPSPFQHFCAENGDPRGNLWGWSSLSDIWLLPAPLTSLVLLQRDNKMWKLLLQPRGICVRSCWEHTKGSARTETGVYSFLQDFLDPFSKSPSQASTSPCQSHMKILSPGSTDRERWLPREISIIKSWEIYGVL